MVFADGPQDHQHLHTGSLYLLAGNDGLSGPQCASPRVSPCLGGSVRTVSVYSMHWSSTSRTIRAPAWMQIFQANQGILALPLAACGPCACVDQDYIIAGRSTHLVLECSI